MYTNNFRKTVKSFSFIVSLAATLLLYQNCGNFQAHESAGLDSFSSKTCQNPQARGINNSSLRRLTKDEFITTLNDLFGQTVVAETSSQLATFPDEPEMLSVDAFSELHSNSVINAVSEVAYRIGELTAASTNLRSEIGGSCLSGSTIDQNCFSNFIANFGKRVLRRPLNDEEIQSYLALTTERSAAEAIHLIVARLISAPEMSFHIETGRAVEGERVALTDYEIASRISYGITGTLPDRELLAAADKGVFTINPASRLQHAEAHARRLMETTQAQKKLRGLFNQWLHTGGKYQPPEAVTTWAGMEPEGLGSELHEELFDYIHEVVWNRRGNFRDLMTTPIAFPKSRRLASIYGTEEASDQAAPSPNHPGLLFRAAVLVSPLKETSPILRGVFIKRQIFCEHVGSPPAEASNPSPFELDHLTMANHEITTLRTSPRQCVGCHVTINPPGFALESYDPLGSPREFETVISDTGEELQTHPLPGPIELLLGGEAKTVVSATEMAHFVAGNPNAASCMSTYVFRHMNRRLEQEADDCALLDVSNTLSLDEPVYEAIVRSVANQDLFWRGL